MKPIAKVCRDFIISALDHYDLPMGESAVQLLCMIAAHESGQFLYAKQIKGPALSPYQIEPPTFLDVCEYAQSRNYMAGEFPSAPERLLFDFRFATGIARVFFLRKPEPIPMAGRITELSIYAKRHWNTHLGKATPGMYQDAYEALFT